MALQGTVNETGTDACKKKLGKCREGFFATKTFAPASEDDQICTCVAGIKLLCGQVSGEADVTFEVRLFDQRLNPFPLRAIAGNHASEGDTAVF